MTIVGSIPRHLERAETVLRFHLTIGHDFMGVNRHWLGLAADEACPLYGHVIMNGDHLLQCTGLDEYPTGDVVSLYWVARRQMVNNPSTGVGKISKTFLSTWFSVLVYGIFHESTDIIRCCKEKYYHKKSGYFVVHHTLKYTVVQLLSMTRKTWKNVNMYASN
ncbi:hypothetical protein TNCV_78921 [Trichonephila clavipes]|nr:hypothetical protein TNCV_78921 [Trichonephila clavipes]